MKGKIVKSLIALCLVATMVISSFAAVVSADDSSSFVTKAEFEAIKSNYDNQIKGYLASVDEKIDNTIANYLNNFAGGNGVKHKYRHWFQLTPYYMTNPNYKTYAQIETEANPWGTGTQNVLTEMIYFYVDDDKNDFLTLDELILAWLKTGLLYLHQYYYNSSNLYARLAPTGPYASAFPIFLSEGTQGVYWGTGTNSWEAQDGYVVGSTIYPNIFSDSQSRANHYHIFSINVNYISNAKGSGVYSADLNLAGYDTATGNIIGKYTYYVGYKTSPSQTFWNQYPPVELNSKSFPDLVAIPTTLQRPKAWGTYGVYDYFNGTTGEWQDTVVYNWWNESKRTAAASGTTMYFINWSGFNTTKSIRWNYRNSVNKAISNYLAWDKRYKGKVTLVDLQAGGNFWPNPA